MLIKIKTKSLSLIPKRATLEASGYDLFSNLEKSLYLEPGSRCLIPTGISVAIPNGYEAQIRSRSGLALKYGIAVLNSPGTIDADYRGEIGVILINFGDKKFEIKPQMRIAQMIFMKTIIASFSIVRKLSKSARSANNFGSTGI